jgi:exodeoxyribonuclease V alpha subunit
MSAVVSGLSDQVATSNMTVSIRVTSVRSRGVNGGAIFGGKTDNGEIHVVIADYSVIPDSSMVNSAQIWEVQGTPSTHFYEQNGIKHCEQQINAAQLTMLRPSGRNLVNWIAQSPECQGIGEVKARRLYEHFGTTLVELIDQGDVYKIAAIVGQESAESLCQAFLKHGIARTLLWLDQLGITRKIGASVAAYYQGQAKEKIEANPYFLVSFEAKWSVVDGLAQNRFGIKNDDPRRLLAATEEVLYRALGVGHTCLSRVKVRAGLMLLLGVSNLVDQALSVALADERICEVAEVLQTSGMNRIESYVAARMHCMLTGRDFDGQGELLDVPILPISHIDASIALYESMNNIDLTDEQITAVRISATNRFSLILGGAGTGKTTVLKALCQALEREQPGLVIYQLALAGRAAQRMTEATGRPSKTIAAFLLDEEVVANSLVLVDEVSMVDVILMYRLLRHLPNGVRLVLIGDPSQLPPIGPGLVLHALADLPSIPQVLLKTAKRQSTASGIPQVAADIRAHRSPTWAVYRGIGSGVSFIECRSDEVDQMVNDVYLALGGNGKDFRVQVLSTTRNGTGGVRRVNEMLHSQFRNQDVSVRSVDKEFGLLPERTVDNLGLGVGDLVIFTDNDYTLGLRNGALGRIVHAVEPESVDSIVCVAEFDGLEYQLNAMHVRSLTHAYAITIHKSQGSQFTRVIIPVRKTRLLDNALIYTAVTRSIEQVVLIGDRQATEGAIAAMANSTLRSTALPRLLAPIEIQGGQ